MQMMFAFKNLSAPEFALKYNALLEDVIKGPDDQYHRIKGIRWTQFVPGQTEASGTGLFLLQLDQRPSPGPGHP